MIFRGYSILLFVLRQFVSLSTYGQSDTIFADSPEFTGKFFSNNDPDSEPLIFVNGLMNQRINHYHSSPVFSPEYDEMYFSIYPNYAGPQCIFISKKQDIWQKPIVANFSGQYQDGRPILAPDGKTLFSIQREPIRKEIAHLKIQESGM